MYDFHCCSVKGVWVNTYSNHLVGVESDVTDFSMLNTVLRYSPVAIATVSCTLFRKIVCCSCFPVIKSFMFCITYFICDVILNSSQP